MDINARFYPEHPVGGFTRCDGTVEFYARVNALIRPQMTILNFGAGRGAHKEDPSRYRQGLQNLRGKATTVIGLDVSSAVLDNPDLDQALVYDGGRFPLEDASVDLIVSDATFEHLPDPAGSAAELTRVLKPGGWICARTPYLYSALVVASSLIPNRLHVTALSAIQPDRKAEDVFPTVYGLNAVRSIRRHFPIFKNYSYTFSPEPAYHFNNGLLYRLNQIYQYIKGPIVGGEVLLIFIQKPG